MQIEVKNGRKFGIPFTAQISLGNILVIAALLVNAIIWYNRVEGHVTNTELHPGLRDRQAEFSALYDLHTAALLVRLDAINMRLSAIEKRLSDPKGR